MWLQDRGGGSIDANDAQLQKFLAAARARPELAGVTSPFTASVPQMFVNVDREKALRQGVALGDVYQTMQTFLGGLYVNQFNRFGRQWRVYLQAEGGERMAPEQVTQFYVRNDAGGMVPLSALQTIQPTFGPQFTNRFNVYRAMQITGSSAPGYSSGQAMAVLEEVAKQNARADLQLRLGRPVVPGTPRGRHEWNDLRAVARLRLPHSRRALRELVAAVLGAADGADRGLRRLRRPDAPEVRPGCVRADWRRHADRAGGQERDPHRRVREDPLRGPGNR